MVGIAKPAWQWIRPAASSSRIARSTASSVAKLPGTALSARAPGDGQLSRVPVEQELQHDPLRLFVLDGRQGEAVE